MVSQLGGLLPGQRTGHLDAAYYGKPAAQTLDDLGFHSQIARLGTPAPIQATQRWPALPAASRPRQTPISGR